MNTSRFVVGLILMAVALAMFLFGTGEYSSAGAIAFGVLGLVAVAISRKKKLA
jgi:hypothetical protein